MDLRTRTKQLGANEKTRRKKCEVRFSLIRKIRVFQKNYMKTGVRKLLRAGLVRARAWGGQRRGQRAHRKAEIEEEQAAASSSRQEGISVALTFHGVRLGFGKMKKRAAEGLKEVFLRSADMETGERTCRSRGERDP